MKVTATLIATEALRKTVKLRKRIPIATAQELNRQRKQSRTLIVRQMVPVSGITNQTGGSTARKRILKRVLLPRPGLATKRRLAAGALTLFEAYPLRYFRRRRRGRNAKTYIDLPAGAVLRQNTRPGQPPYVDLTRIGYAVRYAVLGQLARAWPGRWAKRMRYETQRAFGV